MMRSTRSRSCSKPRTSAWGDFKTKASTMLLSLTWGTMALSVVQKRHRGYTSKTGDHSYVSNVALIKHSLNAARLYRTIQKTERKTEWSSA